MLEIARCSDDLGLLLSSKLAVPTIARSVGMTTVDGLLYLLGGWARGRLGALWEYSPVTNAWRYAGELPRERDSHVMVATLDGRLHILGGTSAVGSTVTTDIYSYDLVGMQWAQAPYGQFPQTMLEPAASTLNGKVYVVAGTNLWEGIFP